MGSQLKFAREKRMRADRVSWIVTTAKDGKGYAAEFHCHAYTGDTLEKLREIMRREMTRFDGFGGDCEGMAAGLEYHWPIPHYEGQEPVCWGCTVLGGKCYATGSSLAASEFAATYGYDLRGEDAAIFDMVERRLRDEMEAPDAP